MSSPVAITDRADAEIDAAIRAIFGRRAELAEAYAALLVGDGITRGVVGPREASRIWERHLLNSACIAPLIAPGSTVVDLGSGAGLPGIPIAIARPDLDVTLLEPMQRRVSFLQDSIRRLRLDTVRVVQGRAGGSPSLRAGLTGPADVVVVRAVARLDRLIQLSVGLLSNSGVLLALKGAGAEGEVEEVRATTSADLELVRLPAPGRDVTVIKVRRGTR